MTIGELLTMPTTLDVGGKRYHESIFRCYHVLQKVIELLDAQVDQKAVAGIARELLELPHVTREER